MSIHSSTTVFFNAQTGTTSLETSDTKIMERTRDEFGDVQLDWTVTGTSTITVKLQARLTPELPWATVKTWTQAELSNTGGTLIDRIPVYPEMQVTAKQGQTGDSFTMVSVG